MLLMMRQTLSAANAEKEMQRKQQQLDVLKGKLASGEYDAIPALKEAMLAKVLQLAGDL